MWPSAFAADVGHVWEAGAAHVPDDLVRDIGRNHLQQLADTDKQSTMDRSGTGNRMTFNDWLRLRVDCVDPIGELARVAREWGDDWPSARRVRRSALRRYMHSRLKECCPNLEVFLDEALVRARQEWLARCNALRKASILPVLPALLLATNYYVYLGKYR